MEYGLGLSIKLDEQGQKKIRLNPSFNGIWSRMAVDENGSTSEVAVLILLLMEYGLGCGIKRINIVVSWS